MPKQYSVHVDGKGHVLIPAEVRKAMGIEPKSLMILCQEGGGFALCLGR
jgi:AbrB family looped-hinge helix DNA binding protein